MRYDVYGDGSPRTVARMSDALVEEMARVRDVGHVRLLACSPLIRHVGPGLLAA